MFIKKNLSFLCLFQLVIFSMGAQHQLLDTSLENFSTSFLIEQNDDNIDFLIAYIELNNGSYVISPDSQDTIYGHLDLDLTENEFAQFVGPLQESPISKESFDSILESKVKFVRTNTRYKQCIQLKTTDDFEAAGKLWFLLEPQCVPYKVRFTLRQTAGQLSVEKVDTTTDY